MDPDWLPCPLTTPFCDPRLCGTQWKTAQPGWLLPPLQECPLPDLAFLSLLVPSSDVGLTLSILGPLTPDHVVTEGTFFPGSGPSLGFPVEFGIDYCVCMCVLRREELHVRAWLASLSVCTYRCSSIRVVACLCISASAHVLREAMYDNYTYTQVGVYTISVVMCYSVCTNLSRPVCTHTCAQVFCTVGAPRT